MLDRARLAPKATLGRNVRRHVFPHTYACTAGTQCQRGFSLLELSIGLLIVATLLSALLVPIATQIDQRRASQTEAILERAREALYGFVIARGRFPCPATDASNGSEEFASASPTPGNASNGLCAQYRGYLPAADLTLSPLDRGGFLVDGYGGDANRVRYAIANVPYNGDGTLQVYTATNMMMTLGMLSISSETNRYLICTGALKADSTACDLSFVTLAKGTAIAVIWSVGKNGSDRVRTPSTDETRNLDDAATNRIFISRTRSDVAGNEFDDLLIWISPNVLISRLAAAGVLPPYPPPPTP